MRIKKPTRVSIEQVRITREGNDAIVDHAEAGISGAHLTIGPEIAAMTDADIVDLYNGILESQHHSWQNGTRRSSKNRRGKSKPTITKTAINGSREATCYAASSTIAALRGKSSFISTTRNCHSPNSAGCSRFMRVGA